MKVIHKFSSKKKGNKTCAVSKYVYHPNANTVTKNLADMSDFANFVKSGWSDLKHCYLLQVINSWPISFGKDSF